ncbi:hypothetical protein EI555_008473 [Monodon monoceros]|uniref:Kazal-like domain-containing protein n=1 Tax=Monodon monoceros TaxID=40151 RepID=A0A4U1FGL6_MONMO|nr:hypothetical protein EI555_008473 [Monodon monoceros]
MKIIGDLLLFCTVAHLCTCSGRLQHLQEAPSGGHPLPHHIPACLWSDYITYGNECHLRIESL